MCAVCALSFFVCLLFAWCLTTYVSLAHLLSFFVCDVVLRVSVCPLPNAFCLPTYLSVNDAVEQRSISSLTEPRRREKPDQWILVHDGQFWESASALQVYTFSLLTLNLSWDIRWSQHIGCQQLCQHKIYYYFYPWYTWSLRISTVRDKKSSPRRRRAQWQKWCEKVKSDCLEAFDGYGRGA